MREIKFRGISIETGKFVYGGIWQPHDPLCDEPNKEVYIVVTEDLGDVLGSEIIEVDPETVGEFTGFTDKNEVDIYEGDIVVSGISKLKSIVVFEEGSFALKNDKDYPQPCIRHFDLNEIEIIGNIHEN